MKYALITRGSSGIGFAFSKQLASKSYSLLLVGNREDDNREAVRKLSHDYPINARYITMDLSIPEAAEQIFDFCKQEQIEVEVLVNNAGMFFFDTVVNENYNRSKTMVQLHVTTPTLLCAMFGHEMKKQRKGYILNISSFSAWMPYLPFIGWDVVMTADGYRIIETNPGSGLFVIQATMPLLADKRVRRFLETHQCMRAKS